MQVESLAVALRKRSNMEAIDLGFALARYWFRELWLAWLIGALPIFLVTVLFILIIDNKYTASIVFFIFWWLKPLYEQPLLYILSRQLFSEPVSLNYIFRNYFQIIKPQITALLFWRRLSLSRSFNNPVAMLEGLTGKERSERLNILHAQQSNSSQLLTIVCIHLEMLLYLSLLSFAFMLIPEELLEGDFFDIVTSDSLVSSLVTYFSYFVVMSLIAPFYVAAGFSLYITRRTKLEGWDIELAFKRLKNRVSNGSLKTEKSRNILITVITFVLFLSSQFVINTPVYAEQNISSTTISEENIVVTQETSKETIQQVLERDDFGKVSKEKQWVYINTDEEKPDEPPKWLEKFFKWLFGDFAQNEKSTSLQILEFLIWLGIAALVVWLLRKYTNWMQWINTETKTKITGNKSVPSKIAGMDISQESLPEDILTTFNTLLNQKRYRQALSLLYRASLSRIIQRGDIEIPSSATERECSQIVSKTRNPNEANYFKLLTHAWILLAYGNRMPSESTLSQLRDSWPTFYGNPE